MTGSREHLRWGVLGTAAFARSTWIPAAQASRFARVIAVASRDAGLAAAAAQELGIPTAHGSYEALLADPDVDAVYIPLPNHLHAPWTIAALEAGKHVLCEKPLALLAEDAQRMAATAHRTGRKLMEAFMYRFHPAWLTLREAVHSGRIGELRAVAGWFSYFNDDPGNIRNLAGAGGGGLYDIGCYPISVARWLYAAEPDVVTGTVHRDPELGVDVQAGAALRFPGGGIATVGCSMRAGRDQWVKVYGTTGEATISVPFNIRPDQPVQVTIGAAGATEVIEIPAANQYTLMVDAFARAVLDGTDVPTPVGDAVGNLRVIEALLALR